LVQVVRAGNVLTITVDRQSEQAGIPGTHRLEISESGLRMLGKVAGACQGV